MEDLKLIFFAVGLLAFAVTAFLGIRNTDLVEGPMGEEDEEVSKQPLKKWDRLAYHTMWVSWAMTAFVIFLEEIDLIN